MGQEEYTPVQEVCIPSLFYDVGSDGRNDLFNNNLKQTEMKDERDAILNATVMGMIELATYDDGESGYLELVMGGVSSAIICMSSEDEDMKKAAVGLMMAIGSVINSSALMREMDIQNQINDLTK
jgi:hypothetical protein